MEKELLVEIVTPEKVAFSGKATLVVVPGAAGELGFQPLHAPLAALLTVGEVRLTFADSSKEFVAISGGYVKVFEDKVTIMAETAEKSSEIDMKRAGEALDRARDQLEQGSGEEIDLLRAQLALRKAEARLKVAEKKKKK